MIAKISRGGRMGGLMAYLAGPGRENEHESPHLVAGSDGLMAWWSTDELSNRDALAIAEHIEQPRQMFGTEVTAPVKEYSEAAGEFVATGERKDVHVWHCSLSLAPDQEALGDEVWGQVARDFVDEMGFSEASGKAPVRWAAVHHGASKNGGDHIHLAISMVREDGTKVSTHNDYKKASEVCNKLEKKYGLEVVEGREVGRSARPESRAEVERATREAKAAGRSPASAETQSARLSRKVRACAVASADEGEFVRRCRREDLWIKPRFAAGTQDVVTGYSVAERPEHGQTATWRAAGHLGRDLTLPRLREGWEDSPTVATEAAAEWKAAWRGQPPVLRGGRESVDVDPGLWVRYADEMKAVTGRLAEVAGADHATWAKVAQETSGVFAAWSMRLEPDGPGPLADTSDVLARSAALHRRHPRTDEVRQPVQGLSLRGPATLMLAYAAASGSKTGQALMIRELGNMTRALYRAQQATSQARTAAHLSTTIQGRLREVANQLPRVDEKGRAVPTKSTPQRTPGSPVPNQVQAPTPARLFDPSRDSGIGR